MMIMVICSDDSVVSGVGNNKMNDDRVRLYTANTGSVKDLTSHRNKKLKQRINAYGTA